VEAAKLSSYGGLLILHDRMDCTTTSTKVQEVLALFVLHERVVFYQGDSFKVVVDRRTNGSHMGYIKTLFLIYNYS